MAEPKEEQTVSHEPSSVKEADFEIEPGAYTVSLNLPLAGAKEYFAKVVILTDEDEEVAGEQKDPFSQKRFQAGDRVYRLRDNTDPDSGSETYNLDSIILLNPDLKAESFTPIPEGEVKEE